MEGMPPAWGVSFAVEDTDVTIAKAEQLGGSIIRPAADTGFGRMALLADPDGAGFAVIKPATG
jgi:predicted enzyme related to lactoylglutathione lyase